MGGMVEGREGCMGGGRMGEGGREEGWVRKGGMGEGGRDG